MMIYAIKIAIFVLHLFQHVYSFDSFEDPFLIDTDWDDSWDSWDEDSFEIDDHDFSIERERHPYPSKHSGLII